MQTKKPKPPRIVAQDLDLERAWEAARDIVDDKTRSEAFAEIAGVLLNYEGAKGILWADKITYRFVRTLAARCSAYVAISHARRAFCESQTRERKSAAHAKSLGITR